MHNDQLSSLRSREQYALRAPMKVSIIIPSAPDRDPKNIIENLKKIRPEHVSFEIITIKGTNPPVQRNLGIKKATGDFIFLFDDDIIIPGGTIEKVLEIFRNKPKIDVVGGANLTPAENSFLQHCFGYAHASHFIGLSTAVRYYPAKPIKSVNENHLISCNLAFHSRILKENPFDPDVFPNEENELLGRLLRKNVTLEYSPEFLVYHHRRKTMRAYLKQIFFWGVGRSLHSRKIPSHLKPSFFVPLLFLCYMVSLPIYHPLWYLLPAILYLFLDIFFVFATAGKNKSIMSIFVMFWLFPLTHLTYGLGLFIGLFKPFPSSKNLGHVKNPVLKIITIN